MSQRGSWRLWDKVVQTLGGERSEETTVSPRSSPRSIARIRSQLLQREQKLSICKKYLNPEGCDKNVCRSLHICPRFLAGVCSRVKCEDGHDINVAHNRRVLRRYNVDNVSPEMLRKLIETDMVAPYLCEEYNLGASCNPDNCIKMHLCAGYIIGNCDECQFNHDILDPQCVKLLKQSNVSLDRTRKELKTYLRRNCSTNIKAIVKQKRTRENEGKSSPKEQSEMSFKSADMEHSGTETIRAVTGEGHLAARLSRIQDKSRVLRGKIGAKTIVQQLGLLENFVGEALERLNRDPALRGWFRKSPFHPRRLDAWLEEKEIEARNFDDFLRKFDDAGVEIRDASTATDHEENMTVITFGYKGIDPSDPLLDSLSACLNENQRDMPTEATHSVYRDSDRMLLVFEYQRVFLHYQRAQEHLDVKFVAVERAELNGPCFISLSEGGGGAPQEFVPPGEPSGVRVVALSDEAAVEVHWNRPAIGCDHVMEFHVWFRALNDACDLWKFSSATSSPAKILGLTSGEKYLFAVTAFCRLGYGPSSSTVSWNFLTSRTLHQGDPHNRISFQPQETEAHSENNREKKDVSLAQKMKAMCEKSAGNTYEFPRETVMKDREHRLARYDIGSSQDKGTEKVIMLLGSIGTGKSTLINGIANYAYGVKWEDDFRFKLITEEGNESHQAQSPTKWITAYVLHKEEGFALPYTLTVIDTPGFGDSAGLQQDEALMNQFRALFSRSGFMGVDHLDGICFVMQAPSARLTPTQEYVFNCILSVFGRDVIDNIYVLITFSDNKVPPVLTAMEKTNMPYKKYFKFNNAVLFADKQSECAEGDKICWDMGVTNFKCFFENLQEMKPMTLTLPKVVLEERKRLQKAIQFILPQITVGLEKLEHLRQEHAALKQCQEAIEVNNIFQYAVKIHERGRVDLKPGEFVTNCLKCNFTCHYPTTMERDDWNADCAVMDVFTGKCLVCPNMCHRKEHINTQYCFELSEKEIITSRKCNEKSDNYNGETLNTEAIVKELTKEFNRERLKVLQLIKRAYGCLQRLNEIALKKDPPSVTDFIDHLMEPEKREARTGFTQRIKYLEYIRAKVESVIQLQNDFDPFKVFLKEFHEEELNLCFFDPDPLAMNSPKDTFKSDVKKTLSSAPQYLKKLRRTVPLVMDGPGGFIPNPNSRDVLI
ncbi:unnamed protein product [Darwinula stevensoni]|uniref:Fibronectin type-III domain-containing protein n=1 Tax=Darwinula stevensoni TaxID=69355 RepID=A0A7R8X7F9_9CRUS|nr:unnamed protein product [Darwinula stevensoni]CAG0883262.1 unnamed protein product [Darwinula stevensoni]